VKTSVATPAIQKVSNQNVRFAPANAPAAMMAPKTVSKTVPAAATYSLTLKSFDRRSFFEADFSRKFK
jgi:hypothetical protein